MAGFVEGNVKTKTFSRFYAAELSVVFQKWSLLNYPFDLFIFPKVFSRD